MYLMTIESLRDDFEVLRLACERALGSKRTSHAIINALRLFLGRTLVYHSRMQGDSETYARMVVLYSRMTERTLTHQDQKAAKQEPYQFDHDSVLKTADHLLIAMLERLETSVDPMIPLPPNLLERLRQQNAAQERGTVRQPEYQFFSTSALETSDAALLAQLERLSGNLKR